VSVDEKPNPVKLIKKGEFMEKFTLITALIGAISGMVGSILGIINIWHYLSTTRVRLKVIPKIAFMLDRRNSVVADRMNETTASLLDENTPYRLCIEVTNLSAFPLTISDAGFGNINEPHMAIMNPELTTGKSWPVRLESRESVTIHWKIGKNLDLKRLNTLLAYVVTDCGKVKYGDSPIFKKYVSLLRNYEIRKDLNPFVGK
jgi:hypothetical protein